MVKRPEIVKGPLSCRGFLFAMFEDHIAQLINKLPADDWKAHQTLMIDLDVYADAAVPHLLKLLRYDEQRTRSAIMALVAIGEPALGPIEQALAETTDRHAISRLLLALNHMGPVAIPTLVKALYHPEWDLVARPAAAMLGQMGSVALKPLLGVVEDSNAKVREAAAKGLVGLRELGLSALQKLIIDPDAAVRRQAMETLRRIGTPPALKILREHRHS